MVFAIDPTEAFEYVLECDRDLPEDEQTRFQLQPLSFRQRQLLADQGMTFDQGSNRLLACVGTRTELLLRAGLVGWENLRGRDEEGNIAQVPFETEGKILNVLGRDMHPAKYTTLGRLHPDHADELAKAIDEVAHLTHDDSKN